MVFTQRVPVAGQRAWGSHTGRIHRPAALILLALAATAPVLSAQEPVAVGSPAVDPALLRRGLQRLEVAVRMDTVERVIGTYAVRVHAPAPYLGRSAMLITQTMSMARGDIEDSVWVDPRSFAPQRQVSVTPAGSTLLLFDGVRVTGNRHGPDTAATPIDVALPQPVFSSSVVTLLVRCLPLRPGYHVRVPGYSDTQGSVDGEVRVEAEETLDVPGLGSRPAWRVLLRSGASVATIWIDRETRDELRTEADLPGGRRLVQRPILSPPGP